MNTKDFEALDEFHPWNLDQSWHARKHFTAKVNGERRKFRFNLRRNAYDNQSFVRLDVLGRDNLTWSTFVSRPIGQTPAVSISYVHKTADLDAIDATCELLLADAAAVLS